MSPAIEITQLLVYPVKSCKPISLDEAVATCTGFLFDRQWLVVDATSPNGRFITQRQVSSLALVEVAVEPKEVLQGAELYPDAALVLRAPGLPELRVPLAVPSERKLVPASVWAWGGLAVDEGDAAAAWFTSYLGRPARLVRYAGTPGPGGDVEADPLRRSVEPYFAAGHEIKFSDQFPYLLASEASLVELNSHLPEAIPMNRFRPNIVVSGGSAFAEDGWGAVGVAPPGGPAGDGLTFEVCKPCSRCKVTTINQTTAEAGDEPLETLHRLRSGSVLGWTEPPPFKNSVFFGANMVVTGGGGVTRVGDALHVLSPQTRWPAKAS